MVLDIDYVSTHLKKIIDNIYPYLSKKMFCLEGKKMKGIFVNPLFKDNDFKKCSSLISCISDLWNFVW